MMTGGPRLERRITPEQADAAYSILVAHAGAHVYRGEREAFVRHVTHPDHPCDEYRFCGSLGFGGKFRNNGNNGGIPYVDCYREHETPETIAIIELVNKHLANIFLVSTK